MIHDFNPLDLSPAPKVQEEKPEPVAPRAKATVSRISMGPILHSRITKIVVLILAVILMFLIGYLIAGSALNKDQEVGVILGVNGVSS